MSTGYLVKCKTCGYKYTLQLGIGMMFPRVYQSCINDIKNGKYGKEWKNLALSQDYIAADVSRCLYVCENCKNWKITYPLSLYKPKDTTVIQNKVFGEQTVKERGYVPYVTPDDLESDYILVKEYHHKCNKCGKEMHKANIKSPSSLPCPQCGTANNISDQIKWD